MTIKGAIMLVTDIEIGNYGYCDRSGRHLASVTMSLKTRSVTLFCRLDLPPGEPPRRRAEAFVAEGTRQLLRMPEFRSGPVSRLYFLLLSAKPSVLKPVPSV